jgi:HSP20 family protein
MTLVKWFPQTSASRSWRQFDPWWQDVDRFFDDVFWPTGRTMPAADAGWAPHVDIVEQDDAYVLRADLPGMRQENIDIQYHDGVLTLRGQRKMEEHETQHDYHHRERLYGTFSRSFALGGPVESEQISATYKNGVLEVSIPKTAEMKTKRIPIKVG